MENGIGDVGRFAHALHEVGPGVGLLKVALALPEIFVACAEAANRDETTNAIAIFFI